jgi:ComF family protein
MMEAWPKWQMPVDVVVPVPLHAKRERKRGYNQSSLLARHLSRKKGWRLLTNGLQRFRYTPPQTGLGRSERLQNVQRAFRADPKQVAGSRILLVDDVVTSGATLAASAEALLEAGAASVSAYCLARATEKTHRADV